MLSLPTDLLDVLDVSGLVVVLDDLGRGAAPPEETQAQGETETGQLPGEGVPDEARAEKLTRPIELPVRETFQRTR